MATFQDASANLITCFDDLKLVLTEEHGKYSVVAKIKNVKRMPRESREMTPCVE